jgi:N-methylhydantoinase A
LEGIKALDRLRDVENVRLGTTVVTNALLERTGAVVAYLTTEGFRDVPFMQRGHRKSHYDPSWIKANPFVKRRHCYEVSERIDYQGSVVVQLDETKLRDLARSMHSGGEIEAIAVMPRWKEYERASTTIADAFIKPRIGRQLAGIRERFAAHGLTERISVIKSNGGDFGSRRRHADSPRCFRADWWRCCC